MKNLLSRIYTIYALFMFAVTSIFFLLPQLVLAQRRNWHQSALSFNHPWAEVYFRLLFLSIQVDKKYKPRKDEQYIICSNHFSYLDIPVMPLIGITFKYIGKSSVKNIPIFGYMFKKIHVMVDRGNLKSRANSIKQASEEINAGFNVVFYPEGGVKSTKPPEMVNFRDGAFRLAVEHDLPVLPVVLHDNYKILPDDGKYLLNNHKLRISILEPIKPPEEVQEKAAWLKDNVSATIQKELNDQAKV